MLPVIASGHQISSRKIAGKQPKYCSRPCCGTRCEIQHVLVQSEGFEQHTPSSESFDVYDGPREQYGLIKH